MTTDNKIEWGGTPGPWRAKPMGGTSTVICLSKPKRNDTRIPAYGYAEENGHCVAYPFTDDDRRTRHDFVCFSHVDARAIAEVPEMVALLRMLADGDDRSGWRIQDLVEPILDRIDGEPK